MVVMAVRLLPDALLPGYIFNWQVGAWGEQMTAIELDRLSRREWVVRHDLRWGERGNHDHVVAGVAVYVLNTKNLKDSQISVEGKSLRVRRLDDPEDSYLADRWVPSADREATLLKRELERSLGFPVAVYPVIVIWGAFEREPRWIDNVCVLNGEEVADWIASRPADLLSLERRRKVADYVESMPRA
jgi:nuclease-like protein